MTLTTVELIVTIASAIGVAELLRILLEKLLSKKKDALSNNKDEFSNLKERIEFNESQTNKLFKQQAVFRFQILRMYDVIADLVEWSCIVDCPKRKSRDVDLEKLKDIYEIKIENCENDKIN